MAIDTTNRMSTTNLLAATFKALSDATRLQIMILLLERGELCVCDVVGTLALTQSKASRHLRYLFNAGLVIGRREGTWMHYSVSEDMRPEQRTVVDALASAIPGEQREALMQQLEGWLKDKATQQGLVCNTGQCGDLRRQSG